jgi:methylated-DNA-protein-cysteine methyltransferase-like protein
MQGQTSKDRRDATAALTPREWDERIYSTVRQIPRGKVAAYGWIAERTGLPRGARRVGRALRTLPSARRIPWHRVVNAQGRISLPAGSASARKQRELLMAEGIIFLNHRIDLARFGWRESLDEYLWRPS